MSKSPYRARLLDLSSLEALNRELSRLQVDRGGVPIMASKGIVRLILVEQIPTAAANIIKQEILARGGDLATPYTAGGFEVPYVDVIFIGNLTTLRSTISKMFRQTAFDLPRIADRVQQVLIHTTPGYLPVAAKASRQGVVVEETVEDLMGGRIPLEPRTFRATGRPACVPIAGHTWRFGEHTYVMGEVTLSSETGAPLEQEIETGRRQVAEIVAEGAQMVVIAGGSDPAQADQRAELDRLIPLVRWARTQYPGVIIAVETCKASVAEGAVDAGAQMLYDRSALQHDPAMKRVVAESGVPVVLAHSQEVAAQADLLADVTRFFHTAMQEAVAAGVQVEQLILDAGFGLSKSPRQDLELTRRLRELTSLGRPVLQAVSRTRTTGRSAGDSKALAEPLMEMAAMATASITNGADIVRVQNVKDMLQCVKLTDALVRGDAGPAE